MLNGDGNENCKKKINSLIINKNTSLQEQHTFLYTSLPLSCTTTT